MKFNHENNKISLMIDDKEAGYLTYEMHEDVMHLVGTRVYPEYQNNGYAALLVDEIVAYAREHQIKTIPVCSYIVDKYDLGAYEDIDAR